MSNVLDAQIKAQKAKEKYEALQKQLQEAELEALEAQQQFEEATQAREEEVRNEITQNLQLTSPKLEFIIGFIQNIPHPILNLLISESQNIQQTDIFLLSSLSDEKELNLPHAKYTDELVQAFNERFLKTGYQLDNSQLDNSQLDNSQSNNYILRQTEPEQTPKITQAPEITENDLQIVSNITNLLSNIITNHEAESEDNAQKAELEDNAQDTLFTLASYITTSSNQLNGYMQARRAKK